MNNEPLDNELEDPDFEDVLRFLGDNLVSFVDYEAEIISLLDVEADEMREWMHNLFDASRKESRREIAELVGSAYMLGEDAPLAIQLLNFYKNNKKRLLEMKNRESEEEELSEVSSEVSSEEGLSTEDKRKIEAELDRAWGGPERKERKEPQEVAEVSSNKIVEKIEEELAKRNLRPGTQTYIEAKRKLRDAYTFAADKEYLKSVKSKTGKLDKMGRAVVYEMELSPEEALERLNRLERPDVVVAQEQHILSLEREIAKLKTAQEQHMRDMRELREQFAGSLAHTKETGDQEMQALRKQFESIAKGLEAEKSKLYHQFVTLWNSLLKSGERYEARGSRIKELEDERGALLRENEQLRKKHEVLDKQFDVLSAAQEVSESQRQASESQRQQEHEEFRMQGGILTNTIRQLRSELTESEERRKETVHQVLENTKRTRTEFTTRLNGLENSLGLEQEKTARLVDELGLTREQARLAHEALLGAQQQIVTLETRVSVAENRASAAEKKNGELERALARVTENAEKQVREALEQHDAVLLMRNKWLGLYKFLPPFRNAVNKSETNVQAIIKAVNSDIDQITSVLLESKQEKEQSQTELQKAREELRTQAGRLAERERELSFVKEQLHERDDEIRELEGENRQWRTVLGESDKSHKEAIEWMENSSRRNQESFTQQLSTLQDELRSEQQKNGDLSSALSTAQAQATQAAAEAASAKEAVWLVQNQLSGAQNGLAHDQERINKFEQMLREQQLHAQQEKEASQRALKVAEDAQKAAEALQKKTEEALRNESSRAGAALVEKEGELLGTKQRLANSEHEVEMLAGRITSIEEMHGKMLGTAQNRDATIEHLRQQLSTAQDQAGQSAQTIGIQQNNINYQAQQLRDLQRQFEQMKLERDAAQQQAKRDSEARDEALAKALQDGQALAAVSQQLAQAQQQAAVAQGNMQVISAGF